ncbi:hypothetical protein NDN08_004665 [Rhodosorus marinus]|uniref:Transmembrane protein n=1 Tax=Rhodosorus marinus TaxID=101924 RepID=A0AAV8UM10_9RHOD|nr:hypothetical protein NDN08_004665 [Rhodosorus marinus]
MKAAAALLRVVFFSTLTFVWETQARFGYHDAENDLKIIFRLRSEDPFANDDVYRKLPNELVAKWDLEAPSTDALGGPVGMLQHVEQIQRAIGTEFIEVELISMEEILPDHLFGVYEEEMSKFYDRSPSQHLTYRLRHAGPELESAIAMSLEAEPNMAQVESILLKAFLRRTHRTTHVLYIVPCPEDCEVCSEGSSFMAPEGFGWSVVQKSRDMNAPTLAFNIGKAARALFADNALHDAMPISKELTLEVTTVHLAGTRPASLGFPWSDFARALEQGFVPGQRLKVVLLDSKRSELLATAAFASSYLVGKENSSRIAEKTFKEVLSSPQGSGQKITEDRTTVSVGKPTTVRMLIFDVSGDSAFISEAGSTSKTFVVRNLAAVLHSGGVEERNTLYSRLIMLFLRSAYGISSFGFPEAFDKVVAVLGKVQQHRSLMLTLAKPFFWPQVPKSLHPQVVLRAHHMQTLVRRFKFSLHKARESHVELSLGELPLALTYAISMEKDVEEIERIIQVDFSRDMLVVEFSASMLSALLIPAVLGALSSIFLGYFAAKLMARFPWSGRRGRKVALE